MIISQEHGYIFVHVWKTGGTSIATVLAPDVTAPARARRLFERSLNAARGRLGGRVLGKHAYAIDIRDKLGSQYDEHVSFGFVRNPWDWLVSWYNFVKRQSVSPDRGTAWNHHLKPIVGGMTFERFVIWVVEENGLGLSFTRRHSSFRDRVPVLQRDWLSDLDGRLIVNHVGKFETLERDFNEIMRRIGRPGLVLPHVNVSSHRHYTEYYNDATRRAVSHYFEADIDTFGYSFGR